MKFQGIVCIITGGSGGLGEATTKRLLELGAKVMIFDLQEPKDELDIINCLNLSFQRVNITDEKQVQMAIENTVKIFGKVNVLINCAGIGYIEPTILLNPKRNSSIGRILAGFCRSSLQNPM